MQWRPDVVETIALPEVNREPICTTGTDVTKNTENTENHTENYENR